ncbi:MAG: tRNA lysidine(34) synthetase TilS [Gemmatimonadales bacterium]
MSLTERFRNHLLSLGLESGPALVAVSGGPDSVVLLDLLVETREAHRLELVVAHLDHGIHPESARVAEQVRSLAAGYGLPVESESLALGPSAGETEARVRRYAWLESVRLRIGAGCILTAHHADDQVETVLMRVLGGSGPAGLAAIAPVTGALVRPLLPFRRVELVAHLEKRGLQAWSDPANSDLRHLRSWIRSEVLPPLRKQLPDVEQNLLRLAAQAARDRAAWNAVLEALPGLDLQVENGAISVAAPALAGYDSALTQAVILALARRIGCRLGPSRVGRVLQLLAGGASGAQVPLGSGYTGELSFGRLRLAAIERDRDSRSWCLDGERGDGVWGRWRFRWESALAPTKHDRGGLSAWFTPEPLTVRAWQPGERVKPLGGTGRRLIVRCFQELRVPRSRRGSWPVVAQNHDIIWIPGVCRSDARIPARGTEALRVDAEYA